jgi:RNA polymerase sigma-70 factor, ECF subfamily
LSGFLITEENLCNIYISRSTTFINQHDEKAMAGYSIEAFEEEVESLYPRLNRALTAYLAGSRIDPEDILQETFLKACGNLNKFNGKSGIYTWLFSIARNLCIDEFRKQKHEKNRSHTPVDEYELASDRFSSETDREEVLILRKVISLLPEKLRSVVIMKSIDEMSYAEISEITGINEQTLKNRMFRARIMLADSLKKMGVDHS